MTPPLDPHRNYVDTFTTVAPDCPVAAAVAPAPRGDAPTIPQIEYDLLSKHPGRYTQQELQFAVHVRRSGLSAGEAKTRREESWQSFFSKSHACLRGSALPKKHGWGIHFDHQGRITLVPVESPDYRAFANGSRPALQILHALRSKRA